MTIQQAISEFLIEQQIRGNSPKTLRYYRNSLEQFAQYSGADYVVASLTVQHLRGYYVHLADRGTLSTISIQTYIRALRAFLRWLYAEEYLTNNLADKFRLPKAQRKTVDVLTDDEAHQLMNCFNTRRILGLRDYCLCALMLDSGLRMHEAVTLTLEHLRLSEGFAIVDGKGNKQRIVPLGLNTRKALLRYIARRPLSVQTDSVFLMRDLCPISDNTVQLLFKRLKVKAGIPRLRAHLLRHTFATRYLQSGGDMYALQQILGHTSLDMVKRYVHFTPGFWLSSHAYHSPLDNLLKR